MRKAFLSVVVAAGLTIGGSAAAHEPFLLPSTFAPSRDYVVVQGGMTDGNFFVPDFSLRGDQPLQLVSPDGARAPITSAMNYRQLTTAEASLATPGTYRITTGQRAGRTARQALVGGVWRPVRAAPAAPPAGATPSPAQLQPPMRQAPRAQEGEEDAGPILESELPRRARIVETTNVLIAETYVSRGAPTQGALAPTGQGFELRPVTHPNAIFVDEGFTFELLNDGRPIPGLHVSAVRGGDPYAAQRTTGEATTDLQGRATLTLAQPGIYVLETRYPAREPGTRAAPAAKSYTYSLTFEVTR